MVPKELLGIFIDLEFGLDAGCRNWSAWRGMFMYFCLSLSFLYLGIFKS